MSHENALQHRHVVLDVEQKRKRRKRRSTTQNDHNSATDAREVIEIQHVIRSIKEYARRTHSLGALQGAAELSALVSSLREVSKTIPEVQDILKDAERRVDTLREYAQRVYEDDSAK